VHVPDITEVVLGLDVLHTHDAFVDLSGVVLLGEKPHYGSFWRDYALGPLRRAAMGWKAPWRRVDSLGRSSSNTIHRAGLCLLRKPFQDPLKVDDRLIPKHTKEGMNSRRSWKVMVGGTCPF
jgi:hypothetical protein